MAKKEIMDTLNINGTIYKTTLTKKFLNRKVWEKPNIKLIKAFIPGTILEIFVCIKLKYLQLQSSIFHLKLFLFFLNMESQF